MECSVCMEFLSTPAEQNDNIANPDNNNVEQFQQRIATRIDFLRSKSLSDLSCTPCGHLFHTKCLQNWLLSNKTCPNCRKDSPVSRIIQIARPEGDVTTEGNDEFRPPSLDFTACLSDNLGELRQQHETLITDFNSLKEEYLSDRDQIRYVGSAIDEVQHDIDMMRAECNSLREAQSTKGTTISLRYK